MIWISMMTRSSVEISDSRQAAKAFAARDFLCHRTVSHLFRFHGFRQVTVRMAPRHRVLPPPCKEVKMRATFASLVKKERKIRRKQSQRKSANTDHPGVLPPGG
jgi:hypothetical protein